MHGKAFAVRFLAFAVRPRRTAKHVFPVVYANYCNSRDLRVIMCYISPLSLNGGVSGSIVFYKKTTCSSYYSSLVHASCGLPYKELVQHSKMVVLHYKY
jgi:hypothetical protein